MIYFKTRTAARMFAKRGSSYKVVDNGSTQSSGRRWAVKVL